MARPFNLPSELDKISADLFIGFQALIKGVIEDLQSMLVKQPVVSFPDKQDMYELDIRTYFELISKYQSLLKEDA